MQTGFSIFVFSCVTFRCVTPGKEQETKTKMAHAGFLLWLAEILNQEVNFFISNTPTFPTVRYLEHFNYSFTFACTPAHS